MVLAALHAPAVGSEKARQAGARCRGSAACRGRAVAGARELRVRSRTVVVGLAGDAGVTVRGRGPFLEAGGAGAICQHRGSRQGGRVLGTQSAGVHAASNFVLACCTHGAYAFGSGRVSRFTFTGRRPRAVCATADSTGQTHKTSNQTRVRVLRTGRAALSAHYIARNAQTVLQLVASRPERV